MPFQAEGRVTGMLAVAAAEPDRFAEADLARVQQVADQVAVPLEQARLTEHDRVRRARLSFLAEASDLLAGSLDQEKTDRARRAAGGAAAGGLVRGAAARRRR